MQQQLTQDGNRLIHHEKQIYTPSTNLSEVHRS